MGFDPKNIHLTAHWIDDQYQPLEADKKELFGIEGRIVKQKNWYQFLSIIKKYKMDEDFYFTFGLLLHKFFKDEKECFKDIMLQLYLNNNKPNYERIIQKYNNVDTKKRLFQCYIWCTLYGTTECGYKNINFDKCKDYDIKLCENDNKKDEKLDNDDYEYLFYHYCYYIHNSRNPEELFDDLKKCYYECFGFKYDINNDIHDLRKYISELIED